MIKNLQVSAQSKNINKFLIHKLVGSLKNELNFKIESLLINFINATEITELNAKFLNHNYSTDILTFDYSKIKNRIDAEIFISLNDAKLNSQKYKVHFQNEIARLVIHGILHLLGYNDQRKNDKIIMKRMENELLNKNKFILLRRK